MGLTIFHKIFLVFTMILKNIPWNIVSPTKHCIDPDNDMLVMAFRCISTYGNVSMQIEHAYRTWKAGSALLCWIIKKSQKVEVDTLKINNNNVAIKNKHWILLTAKFFFSTIYLDFIFVDFDKILDKFMIYSAFYWRIIFCRLCLPGTVVIVMSNQKG